MCNKTKNGVRATNTIPRKQFIMNKDIKLLEAPKLLASEWEVVEKLLQGHHETRHGKEVFFEDGFSWMQWSGNEQYFRSTGWECEEKEVFRNIRDLDVDPSAVREYLQSIENPKEYYQYDPKHPWYTIKEFVQDGIIELQFLFSKAAFKY